MTTSLPPAIPISYLVSTRISPREEAHSWPRAKSRWATSQASFQTPGVTSFWRRISASLMGSSCRPYSALVDGVMMGRSNFWSFLRPAGQSMP